MDIRPLYDRVLVRRADEETKTAGGIVLPGAAQEKPMQGIVVSTGKGKILTDGSLRALEVKLGDSVLFAKYSGTEVKFEGEELLMMREEDIMAVLE